VPVFVIGIPLLKIDHLSELAASSWYPTFNALFLIKKNAPTKKSSSLAQKIELPFDELSARDRVRDRVRMR